MPWLGGTLRCRPIEDFTTGNAQGQGVHATQDYGGGRMQEPSVFVGWDWGGKEHELHLSGASLESGEKAKLSATPEAVHEWAAHMMMRFPGQVIGVCLETSRGPVISALMAYPHIVLYPVNPKSVANFREAFYPSGKKDDPVDAETLNEMLAKHADRLRAFRPADPATRLLGLLSEHRRSLVNERVRTTQRLREALKSYFPQALELVGELGTVMACDFLDRWPDLTALGRARKATVRAFYMSHGSRSSKKIDQRIEIIGAAKALTDDPAVMRAGVVRVRGLVRLVRSLIESIAEVDHELESVYLAHPEHQIVDSFPGLGAALGPRVIAILGSDRDRMSSAEQMQLLTGVAPVTSRSGGKHGTISVHRRVKRSKFLHQTIVEWAGHSVANSAWAHAYYSAQETAGKGRYTALRALGFKWIRILHRCWSLGINYDENAHQQELLKRGSPIAKALAA